VAVEIERKFLVDVARWDPGASIGVRYRQGYLSSSPECTVRVRVAGEHGVLGVKGPTEGITRLEFEYPIPVEDAEAMLRLLVGQSVIEKVRYRVPVGPRTWEVDVFEAANAGLVLAEVELPSADAVVEPPEWVGREVSGDPRYYNAYLARHPFTSWPPARPGGRAHGSGSPGA
jgi:adenylate cyclase